jgi:hypothetical protein
MRLLWILGSAVLVTLGLMSGCNDDDDDTTTPGTGGNGGAAGAATGGTPAGGGGAGGNGGEGGLGGLGGLGGGLGLACDPQGDAACQNETDCPFVTSGQLQSAAYQCGENCGEEDDPEACAVECISGELDATQDCSSCYAQLVACSNEFCFPECTPNPSSQDCKDCLDVNDCSDEFAECGGIELE